MGTTLAGRIGIVTGASAGIGEATARLLVAEGACVVVNARREARLRSLVRDLGESRATAVAGDAADADAIEQLFVTAREQFGGGRREADLVVVNAGRGLRGGIYDSDASKWEEILRVNVLSATRLMRRAMERWIGDAGVQDGPPKPAAPPTPPDGWPACEPRDIIVLGSSVGRHVSPFSAFYGSAKAGVHMAAESLRRVAAAYGIRVSLIEPGIVRTEFQEAANYDAESFGAFMDRIGPVLGAEDVARVVHFIASQPAWVHVNDVMLRPTRQEYP